MIRSGVGDGRSLPRMREPQGRRRTILSAGYDGNLQFRRQRNGGLAQGGYSKHIVVDENHVLKINSKADLASIAPLLCAALQPLLPAQTLEGRPRASARCCRPRRPRPYGREDRGCHGRERHGLYYLETKIEDAKKLGAHHVILSKDEKQMNDAAGTFDFLLDTVSADHDISAYPTR